MLTSKAHWLTVSSANSVLRQTHVLGRLHKRRYFRYCWLRYQEPIVKNFVLVLYSTNLYNLSKKVDIFKESTSNQINMRTFDYSRSYLCIYLFLRFFILFCFVFWCTWQQGLKLYHRSLLVGAMFNFHFLFLVQFACWNIASIAWKGFQVQFRSFFCTKWDVSVLRREGIGWPPATVSLV